MTVIGIAPDPEGAEQGVRLHSCPSCGRHAWRQGDREVDRGQLLQVLRAARSSARPAPAAPGRPAAAPASSAEDEERARREELQQLLSRFTVHGSSS